MCNGIVFLTVIQFALAEFDFTITMLDPLFLMQKSISLGKAIPDARISLPLGLARILKSLL